jgi:hypothetical protein
VNGVVLTFENGMTSGAFEDATDGAWIAEAQRHGVPYAEGTGDSPLNAVMALAQALAGMVSEERTERALERLDEAQTAFEVALTPEQAAEVAAAKARLAERRAAQS